MAKRAHAYPQVDPGAAALVDAPVASVPRGARVGEALRLARRRQAVAVSADGRAWILRDDLARAARLGLDELPAAMLARPVPAVESRVSEIAVRRHLASGAPVVIVRDGRRGALGAIGAVAATTFTSSSPRFPERLSAFARDALTALGPVAREQKAAAFLVGGVVRDALRSPGPLATRDLDVVVEGDGIAVARALAGALGVGTGGLTEHARFLTASLTSPQQARVDIATARSERYETPGALPRVMPASIGEDLGRRDFTINAMAVELASEGYGVLDPFGGRAALAQRRIAVLHPLSFVEDPTRLFRAARYAARLGFTLDAWTARAVGLALRLAPYAALSGQRLATELALIVGDQRPDVALRQLGTAGVFRLLAADHRFSDATAERVRRLPAALAWCRAHGVTPTAIETAAVVVLFGQPPAVIRAALDRLVITGEPRARIERALARRVTPAAAGTRASDRARPWWGLDDLEILVTWLGGGAARRDIEWFVETARTARPALGGDDVVAAGVAPGPRVAEALRALRDARLDRRVTDRDSEVLFVQGFVSRKEG